eukprot:14348804-Alexandrium_andersonii.AAC.1
MVGRYLPLRTFPTAWLQSPRCQASVGSRLSLTACTARPPVASATTRTRPSQPDIPWLVACFKVARGRSL